MHRSIPLHFVDGELSMRILQFQGQTTGQLGHPVADS